MRNFQKEHEKQSNDGTFKAGEEDECRLKMRQRETDLDQTHRVLEDPYMFSSDSPLAAHLDLIRTARG